VQGRSPAFRDRAFGGPNREGPQTLGGSGRTMTVSMTGVMAL
jgi:hypothetical protein